jgi:F0F1-type ATP synthase assembly protein I
MEDKNKSLLQYAGLATQFAIAIALAVFIGIKIDKWMALKTPIFTWILPLVFIVAIIYKIVKDTSPKNKK